MDLYQNYSTTDFHRKAQTIASNIQKISQNVSSMSKMINQMGSPSVANNQSSSIELQTQLLNITRYTGQLAKDTSLNLKELNDFNLNDQKQLKLQREKLASDFGSVLNAFQTVQKTAQQKEKDLLKISKNENQSMPFLEGPNKQQSQQTPQQHSQQMLMMEEEQESVELMRQREQAIRQLESDILDVNQIFKELATMVHDQGDMVDSIEANVESAHIQVEEGTRELAQAHTYQNKARKKQLMIIIVIVVLVVILGLIIRYS